MLTLWSGVLSSNAAKVRIVLGEKGLDYEVRNLSWTRANAWGEKPADFLAVSPRAQVPVLIDGDLVIHDSTVINEYLEERYPEPALMPADPAARARCRLWEDEADDQQRHLAIIIRDVYRQPPGTPVSAEAAAASAAVSRYLDRLDAAIGDKDTVCDSFSMADISTLIAVTFAQTLGIAVTQENVVRWFATVSQRPVAQAEIEAMMVAAAAA